MAENIPIATPCRGRGAAEYANSSPMERVDMSVSAIRALQYDSQITADTKSKFWLCLTLQSWIYMPIVPLGGLRFSGLAWTF